MISAYKKLLNSTYNQGNTNLDYNKLPQYNQETGKKMLGCGAALTFIHCQ